jgi:hypothetical protein
MSGATIDYELRPAKNVDRRVFVDLLARSERYASLEGATYVSMGGYPMTDHKMLHRRLDVANLVSIDGDAAVVARQIFNKPTEKCICLHMHSGELIEDLDDILENNGVDVDARKVVWLDYTKPNKLNEQLNEFESLLNKSAEHDIVRITLNANNDALSYAKGSELDAEALRAARFKALEKMIGNYLPNGSTENDLSKGKFPILLSKVLGRAAEAAFPPSDKFTFFPLSVVSYQDGQRMLTMTGVVLKKNCTKAFLKDTDFDKWAFFSKSFDDVNSINVAVLTMKERMLMERLAVSSKVENVVDHLGFEKFGQLSAIDYFEDFKGHAKFYPTHAQLDL